MWILFIIFGIWFWERPFVYGMLYIAWAHTASHSPSKKPSHQRRLRTSSHFLSYSSSSLLLILPNSSLQSLIHLLSSSRLRYSQYPPLPESLAWRGFASSFWFQIQRRDGTEARFVLGIECGGRVRCGAGVELRPGCTEMGGRESWLQWGHWGDDWAGAHAPGRWLQGQQSHIRWLPLLLMVLLRFLLSQWMSLTFIFACRFVSVKWYITKGG